MQATNWKDIADLVGTVAIVASLIFVGFEMRQTRSIALAETYQARADTEISIVSANLQPDSRRLWLKVTNNEALSADDEWLLEGLFVMRFAYLENLHFQMEIEMLSRELWDGQMNGLSGYFALPRFVEWWESASVSYRPSFSRDINEVIERNDHNNQRSD